MPARDLEPAAEALLEHVDIADAVLEADDRRALAACSAISRGGLGGVRRS